MPWHLPQRSVSLSHFAAPCQQLFFVFVNFFHRSGKVVFLSAVCEATQSSTRCQQLFSTFRFFSSTRRVVVVARCEPSQNHARCQQLFCGLRKNPCRILSLARRPRRSLCHCQSPLRPALAASVRREKRLWTLSRQRSRHFLRQRQKNPPAVGKGDCLRFYRRSTAR